MATHEMIQVFIPEGDRDDKSIPVDLHDRWAIRLLALCSELFGGATPYGRGVGVWEGSRARCWDRVTVVEAWYAPGHPGLRRGGIRGRVPQVGIQGDPRPACGSHETHEAGHEKAIAKRKCAGVPSGPTPRLGIGRTTYRGA